MSLIDAFNLLRRDGYCLWVGAGASIHLARTSSVNIPDWRKLVELVEESVEGLKRPPHGVSVSLPERLDVCLRQMERHKFQEILKRELFDKVAAGIKANARANRGNRDPIPTAVRQIARLGMLANPIVNFNVETFTSRALAHASGPYVIRAFNPGPGHIQSTHRGGGEDRYARAIYHPHGALEMYGICVMAEQDYSAMNGTLALELATHAAFESHLVIVGMSLEDRYLRRQLASFREHIRQVFWFVDKEPDSEARYWAWRNDIEIRVQSWPEFWETTSIFPSPDEINMADAWQTLLSCAVHPLTTMSTFALNLGITYDTDMAQILPRIQRAAHMGERVTLEMLLPKVFENKSTIYQIDPESDEGLLYSAFEYSIRLNAISKDQ